LIDIPHWSEEVHLQ